MPELTNSRLIKYIAIILLIGIVLGSVSLVYPFGRDQGIYAYAGQQILDGKLQYKYVFDLKPPAVHFTYALGEILIGTSMQSLRIFDLIWQCATALIIFFICLRITKTNITSLISAALYLFLYYRFDYWQSLQADSFLNLPFALSVFLLLKEPGKDNLYKYFIAGILFAAAALFKFTILGFLPLFFILIYFYRRKYVNAYKYFVFFTSGFVLLILFILIVFISGGAFKEFIDVNFVQLPNYANIGMQTETGGYIIKNILRLFFFSIYSPLILIFAVHIFLLIKNKKFDFKNGIILIWAISVLINLIVQWKFFQYHFTSIFPPLAAGL